MACEIEGCPDAVWARGWCQKRYYRWYRTGDPLKARPKLPDHSVCSVKGCNRPNEGEWLLPDAPLAGTHDGGSWNIGSEADQEPETAEGVRR